MAVNLSSGAISVLSSSEWHSLGIKPVLQVTDVRTVPTQTGGGGGEGKERYRVLLSDGSFHQQGMLATQRNDLVRSNQLQKGSIVQLTEFVCNQIRERVIIIIIDLDLMLSKCDIIGDPKPFPVKLPGNETPSEASYAAPMQSSLNQPAVTDSKAQSFAEGSLSGSIMQPNFNVGPPVQTAERLHSARLHSYGSSFNTTSESVQDNLTRAASQQPPANNRMQPIQPVYNPPPPTSAFQQPPANNRMQQQIQPVYNPPPPTSGFQQPPANNRMQPIQPIYNPPPPMYGNRGPMAKNEAPSRIIPIAALNPYIGRWTIKARVTVKSELRRYNNAKGDGKVFSFDLLDSNGGEIRVTCFNAVAEQFYDQIEVGKVYYISRGSVKPAQKAFNHLKNDHEITLDHTSTVQPCFDDDTSIPSQQFHFRSIGDIENMDNNSVLDTIGVVYSIKPVSLVTRKIGGETQKQELSLKDMSGRSIEFTLWGNFCNVEGQKLINMCDSGQFPVLAVKSARVNEYNGKSIGTISLSQLSIEPDLPEARKLRVWYDSVGRNTPSVSMSQDSFTRTDTWKTISQIKDENLGTSDKPDLITVNATVWHMKVDNFCYTACPNVVGGRKCSKKVVNNGDGKWRCDKCDNIVDECEYRYILQLQIQDHTGSTWTTAFQETGEAIMGVSAKELYFVKHEEQDEDRFAEIVRNALSNEYTLRLKVKEETYGDDQRIKSTVVKAEKINFSSQTKVLLLDLQKVHIKEDPSSIAPNYGVNSQIGTVGHQETPSSVMNNVGGVTGIGQQAALPASHVGHYGSQYGGSSGNSGASGECFKCRQTGHWARDCPGVSNVLPPYGSESVVSGRFNGGMASAGGSGGASGECFKCRQPGHWARDCPGVSNVPSNGKHL